MSAAWFHQIMASLEKRIVVTGMGPVTPVGIGLEEFWSSLLAGKSGVGYTEGFDTSQHDCKISAEIKNFNMRDYIDARDARRMDRFCQFAVVAAKLALQNSGLCLENEDRTRIGVSVGTGVGGSQTWESQHKILLEKGPSRVSPLFVPMMIANMASGQISIQLGLKGPNTSVTTACASGSHSIGDASEVIKRGAADVMLAGGAEASITSLTTAGFSSAKALSMRNDDPEHASRPFDANRDGFVMGEGAAVLVVESLEHALARGARIYGEVVGYGLSADAYNMVAMSPDGEGGARCMEMALKNAGIGPLDIDYINAHGTSTGLGDIGETQAIKSVFGEHAYKLAVSSTKSMTGHMLGAAGAVESIACIMAILNGIIPPTINYETPDPACDLDYVPNKPRKTKVTLALNNSFGFGGHNATLIFKKYE